MQSDEKTIIALSAQAHNAEADKRTLQKKLVASERRVQDLEKRLVEQQAASDEKVRELTDRLSHEMAKVSDMMQQLVSYMMGKGDVTLAGTIHETVVAGIREEVRQEFRALLDEKDSMLSEKDARIAALEALVSQGRDGESPGTTIKKLERQNEDLRRTTYGQKTEGKYNGRNNMTPADEADMDGGEVPESEFDVSEKEFSEIMDAVNEQRKQAAVKSRGRKKGQKVPQRLQPLKETARKIVIEPEYLPEGAVLCEGQEERTYRIVRHPAWSEMVCFVRPKYEKDHKYYQAKSPKHGLGKCKADASILSWIIYEHLVKHVTLGEIEAEMKTMGLNIPHSTLCHWIELAADRLEPLDEPLHQEIVCSGNFHSDESTLQVLDVPVGTKEGEEVPMHYYIRWIYDFIAPGSGLTQYWFYGQGRRSQEAVEEYVKGVTEKTYIHTDGAKMYEIYNAAGVIMRVACAVHVRRPLWKLKDTSDDAARVVYLFDGIFRKERKWNDEKGMTDEERRRRRLEEVAPILHEIKNILDRMQKELDKETEPDLVRAVNFALKEYPQLLRYLDDGRLAFSNNICELQMRQIAIYRNNSYFLGSVKSAKRFARLVSLAQSAKNCKRNVQKYFHDILNRVMVTVKEDLVSILPHKWVEPVTIPLVY